MSVAYVTRELPSGLVVAEIVSTEPRPRRPPPLPPLPPDPPEAYCRACGKACPFPRVCLLFWGHEGWHTHKPACRHPNFYTCPDCDNVPHRLRDWDQYNCPECGCGEEYT